MIYPSDFESKIGFDVVRLKISEKCESESGRAHLKEMTFNTDFQTVRKHLFCVKEVVDILSTTRDLPLDSLHDMEPHLAQLQAAGSFMPADRLHRLLLTLLNLAKINSYFSRRDDSLSPRYPWLASEFSGAPEFPELIDLISGCIGKYGEVKDNASPELYEIRRALSSAQGSIQKTLRRVLDSAVREGIVDKDAAPSLRDGRMVIPVPSTMKRRLSGIVHDESATGKTFFIEPAEVVEASNRLKELEMDERREVTRILISIADSIRPYIQEIAEGCGILGHLDFIRAKALFAMEVGGEMPVIESVPEIDWFHAVHPGLFLYLKERGREVVPLALRLDSRQRILVVSGPNAGGKSVTLKTVAVVQYMMQCGVLPTLYSNSHMGVFSKIMIDIGDEQSMENDLSTYSSHLKNMKVFVQQADGLSLVLADEMGSGTEPQIGGAIAQAILEKLAESGCFGIVTTHYQNLKSFADTRDGLVNGAMLYDRQHLKPLFQLSVGTPGSSFALEIARNTGLSKEVIDHAKEIVGADYVNLDKYLLDIARDRRYWSNKRLSIKEKEHKLDSLLENYEDSAADLRQKRNEIIHQAKAEAREIVASANARIEKVIREIREANAEKEATRKIRKDIDNLRESLSDNSAELSDPIRNLRHKSAKSRSQKPAPEKRSEEKIEVGSYVKMSDGGVVGKVLSLSGKQAEVAFGALRTRVDVSKLTLGRKPAESALSQTVSVSRSTSDDIRARQLSFRNEIDVRGMRADEALQAVTYFVDDAIQFNASKVRILHGTGHGILKTLIRQMLKANPVVDSFHDEDVRFGGAGITVVEFGK